MTQQERVLELAKKQLGIKESPAGSNNVLYNTAYYGKAVSGSWYPWCVTFIWWLFDQTGLNDLFYSGGKTASTTTLFRHHRDLGQTVPISDAQPGDIICFNFEGNTDLLEHVGIFVGWDGPRVQTIDGNTGTGNEANGGAVMLRTRSTSYVGGVIRPNYQVEKSKQTQMVFFSLDDIERITNYVNTRRLSLPQIMQETGADYGINSWYFGEPEGGICHVKADGVVYENDPEYTGWGPAWDVGPDLVIAPLPDATKQNYGSATHLIHEGKPLEKLYYDAGSGRLAPNSALLMADGKLGLYCTEENVTPEILRDFFAGLWNIQFACKMDGGGSTQMEWPGGSIDSERIVEYVLLIHLKKKDVEPPVEPPVSKDTFELLQEAGYLPGIERSSNVTGEQLASVLAQLLTKEELPWTTGLQSE